ncbi:MAG: hypothetical protein WC582_01705 [Patescibacteria group bacterium]
MSEQLKGKKIIIFQQRGWAKNVGYYLAEGLKKEGCKLAALTLKKSSHRIISEQKSAEYEYVINIDDIFDDPYKYLGDEEISLEEICKELNIDSVWPMIYSNRLFSRSYGEKFYYGYKQNVSDEFIAAYLKAYYKVIRNLFNNFKPDAIFTAAFIYEGHTILNFFADKFNIPIVSITDSRVPGYYVFTGDYLDRKGPLLDRFSEINKGKKSENLAKSKEFIKEFRERFKRPEYAVNQNEKISLIKKIRAELAPYRRILGWYLKRNSSENYIKSVGPTIDYKSPKIILRDHYYQKKYKNFAKNFKYYPLDKINKFVFYPLQFTPEGSADLRSPLYNNQLELARQIAMSLPGDYTLVVKEHPAMVGLRSPSYYEKISRTLNVKLVDYRISSEEIIKKSGLVISSYGTVLFESAFFYKPAIILSDAKIFTLLPNVFKHTDISSLSQKMKELLKINLKNDKYEKQLENYISAVFDVGFTADYRKAWYQGEANSRERLIDLFIGEINRRINEKN